MTTTTTMKMTALKTTTVATTAVTVAKYRKMTTELRCSDFALVEAAATPGARRVAHLLPWSNWSCCVQAVGAAIRSDTAIFAYNQQYWRAVGESSGERRWRLSLPRLCLYFVSTKLNVKRSISRLRSQRDEFDGLDRVTLDHKGRSTLAATRKEVCASPARSVRNVTLPPTSHRVIRNHPIIREDRSTAADE